MTSLLDQGIRCAGLGADLPFVQILGVRQDRTSYLVYSDTGRERVAHVKIATSAAGRDSLITEHATLTRLAGMAGLVGRIPEPRAWLESGGTAVNVVSNMPGRPLDVVLARRRPRSSRRAGRFADQVLSWLDVLQGSTRQGSHGVAPNAACERLREAGVERDQVERVREILTRHVGVRLPRVIAHGDLWPGNVLVDRAGHVGVVDWETADPDADPYDDLLFFLLTFVRATLSSDAALADAVHAGLLGGSPWRTELVWRHILRVLDRDQVPRELAAPLILLFLAKRVVGHRERARRNLPTSTEWPQALARYVAGISPAEAVTS